MASFLRQSMFDPSLTPEMRSHEEQMKNRKVQDVPQEIGEAAPRASLSKSLSISSRVISDTNPVFQTVDVHDDEVNKRAAEMDDNISTRSVKSLPLSENIHEEPNEDATRIHDLLDQRKHQPPVVAEGKRRPSMEKDPRNIEGKAIAEILCSRTNAKRQEIARFYSGLYGCDLMETLHNTYSGEFGELLQALLETPACYDARQLHRAIKSTSALTGLSTKDSTLIEILCTRNKEEIQNIKRQYRRLFGSYLEHDISRVTWSHLMHLFMWLVVGARDDSTHVDEKLAYEDARAMWRGEEGVGFDATLYNVVFSLQNFAQLRAVLSEYKKIAEVDTILAVDDEFTGDHKHALETLIMNVNNDLPIFFAHRLHSVMHSLTKHDTSLTRILVTRSEIDLKKIKQTYERLYGKSLEVEIAAYCSGRYRDGLLALVRSY